MSTPHGNRFRSISADSAECHSSAGWHQGFHRSRQRAPVDLAGGFQSTTDSPGATRSRPGLREALAAVRAGGNLVVNKLDRLARSLPDAQNIADELNRKEVALSLSGNVYDPTDPAGRLQFNPLGTVAEFEANLIRMRTREGMAVACEVSGHRGHFGFVLCFGMDSNTVPADVRWGITNWPEDSERAR